MTSFTVRGAAVPDSYVCRNIFSFCAFMAASVAAQRGGRPSVYLSECADFIYMILGTHLSVSDRLPADYDWSAASARELAVDLMEYDS